MFELTRFAKSGGPLTKRISLVDGKIHSDGSACVMTGGLARREILASPEHLAALIGDLRSNEALALGSLRTSLPDEVTIVTKGKLNALNGSAGNATIARTADHIVFRDASPAFALIDFDSKGMPAHVELRLKETGGFWRALQTVLPEIGTAGHVIRRSTSAGITRSDTGEELAGSRGIHLYTAIADGRDTDRFLRTLHDRCWLAGFGWSMTGKAGQILERSIVDRMVSAPERLVFEGMPILIEPLTKTPEVPASRDGDLMDTRQACRPLSLVEDAELRELKAAERVRLRPEIAKAREGFIKEHTARLVERGIPAARAQRMVERQVEGILHSDVRLPFDDPDLAAVTVADVLADPARYEGETLADPLEGVEYGAGKAKILRRPDGTPWIHSFAHGRTAYELRHDAQAVEQALNDTPIEQMPSVFVRLAAVADLQPDEITHLRDLAAERSGAGRRDLSERLKAAKGERHRADAEAAREWRQANRQDPRPQLSVPAADAEWMPVMQALNDVLGGVTEPVPPMRDLNGNLVGVRRRPVGGTHLLTARGSNAEETDETTLPAPEEPLLTIMNEMEVAEQIERHVEFADNSGRSVHLPMSFVKHFANRQDQVLPVVHGIATLPLVLHNGEILSTPGYDRQHKIVLSIPSAMVGIAPSAAECTPAAVAEAMSFLVDEWLVDVPTDYAGKCALVAMALTIIERVILPDRPAFNLTAAQRAAGKSTTTRMISLGVLGRDAAAAMWTTNEDERRKALFSYFREGTAMLVWDNIPRGTLISCQHIESALTTGVMSDRVLSVSSTETVAASAVMIFNGNNIFMKGDMGSRTLNVRLNVDRPDPENRSFHHADPLGWSGQNRGKILRQLYTVLLGNPRLTAKNLSPAKTRFKSWWHLVGSAVENAAREHANHVVVTVCPLNAACPPQPVDFSELFASNNAADEQSGSLEVVLKSLKGLEAQWEEEANRSGRNTRGFTSSEVADYAVRAEKDSIDFRAALESASGKQIRTVTATVITWRLRALCDTPVCLMKEDHTGNTVADGTWALRYAPGHHGGLFRVERIQGS